jgi:hypothetical protein
MVRPQRGVVDAETWSLVEALRARGELTAAGRAALAAAYADAPPVMLDTAAFHLFTDGAAAAIGWLALRMTATDPILKDRFVGCLRGLAMGDALATKF